MYLPPPAIRATACRPSPRSGSAITSPRSRTDRPAETNPLLVSVHPATQLLWSANGIIEGETQPYFLEPAYTTVTLETEVVPGFGWAPTSIRFDSGYTYSYGVQLTIITEAEGFVFREQDYDAGSARGAPPPEAGVCGREDVRPGRPAPRRFGRLASTRNAGRDGGADGTRTRNFWRDRPVL